MIAAERALRTAELEREQAIAESSRRHAALDRALGRVAGLGGTP